MASSRAQSTLQWSGSGTKTLNANSTIYRSDAFSFNAETYEAVITITDDNAGTPATGDYTDFWWAAYDGSNYDTDEHAIPLGRLNTYGSDNPGEDPARKTIQLPTALGQGQLVAKSSAAAATRNHTISAVITEHKAA